MKKIKIWDKKKNKFLNDDNYLITLDGEPFLAEIETGFDIEPRLWNGLKTKIVRDGQGYIKSREFIEEDVDRYIIKWRG